LSRRLTRLFAVACAVGLVAAAHAQLRTIPQQAQRGELRHLREALVLVDGEPRRLAPGAQIRDRENRIVLPASLPPEGVRVAYLLDTRGELHRAWILTDEEAARGR